MECLGFLLCLWVPVQAALQTFLGTVVGDCLNFLRDQAVAQVRNLTCCCGNLQAEPINISTDDLVGREEINEAINISTDDLVGINEPINISTDDLVGREEINEPINIATHDLVGWEEINEPINISTDDLVGREEINEPITISRDDLVGREEINGYLKNIEGYLNDDSVGVIGIYGMSGVGKTTLLQTIYYHFQKIGAAGFDVVMWVTVSQDPSILNIQKQIGDRLGLSLSADTAGSSSQAEEQAKAVILKALLKRRFLLLLDDAWEKLDLKHVGIPHPTADNKKCKIILTTTSEEVCINMGAEKRVSVNQLNASESWKLFKKKLGTRVNLDDPCIKQFAMDVVHKCGRLPLALITVGRAMATATTAGEWAEALEQLQETPHKLPVGRAMATATTAGEWEEALEQLRETPHKLPGMKDEVLSLLKISFDRLGDESIKQCLLYCCLFPEDHEIPVEAVIEYWVGEGFLDDSQSDSIVGARNRGHGVITELESACLLETGWDERLWEKYLNGSYVKMHDKVREMCLWLTGDEFDRNNTFLLYAGSDRVSRSERWGDAKRIALMRNWSPALPDNIPLCRNLRTLLCNSFTSQHSIPGGFFAFMPVLCVLDLSYSWLQSLPEEISFLAELRYLKLRETDIRSLPRGLGKLAKLSQLDLDYTKQLSDIPREAIPTLTDLQVLGMYKSGYNFILPNVSPDTADDNMGEDSRSCWDRLEELRLSVHTLSSLQMLLNLDSLCLCTTRLQIYLGGNTGITPAHLSGELERLEKVRSLCVDGDREESEAPLDIGNRFGSNLEELELIGVPKITVVVSSPHFFKSLRLLSIRRCHGVRDLTWIRQLPSLQEIRLSECEGMEELLSGVSGRLEEREVDDEAVGCDDASLPALRRISLRDLRALESISARPLLLPSLEYLHVQGCRELKKLPFGPNSAQNIRQIWGESYWWEQLRWHQDADSRSVKSRFLPYYVEWKTD